MTDESTYEDRAHEALLKSPGSLRAVVFALLAIAAAIEGKAKP